MAFVAWIVLGLISGFMASKIVNKTGEGVVLDVILGMVGALVGGVIFNAVGEPGVAELSVWSLVVAVFGAVVLLVVYHAGDGRIHA